MHYMKLEHTGNTFQGDSLVIKLIKWWLAFLVLTIPFQARIVDLVAYFSKSYSQCIGYLDEVTILLLLPPALYKIFINKEYPIRLHTALIVPIVVVLIAGCFSGFLNKNAIDL